LLGLLDPVPVAVVPVDELGELEAVPPALVVELLEGAVPGPVGVLGVLVDVLLELEGVVVPGVVVPGVVVPPAIGSHGSVLFGICGVVVCGTGDAVPAGGVAV
jgi:hypothetical protein